MAKQPIAGEVKTRLMTGFTAAEAAEVAEAMLRCVAQRLAAAGRLVLAATPDGVCGRLAERLGVEPAEALDQGPGDLGARLERVWRRVGADRPVAFFGGDSPDLPEALLGEIPGRLAEADVVVGPTGDGGYWTLASTRPRPEVLARIDWGTPNVYDLTCRRARAAGLTVGTLPEWHDIDLPEDVEALRQRLRGGRVDAPLRRLAERLESIRTSGPRPPATDP